MKQTGVSGFIERLKRQAQWLWTGIWDVPSTSRRIKVLKTLNLSVRTFLNTDLQNRASALTFTTVLAIVPMFSLLLAIGKGFGLQDIVQQQLYAYFPSQSEAIKLGLEFVEAYLKVATEGVFMGIGILFLLWTLVSLLGNIENSFNRIWGLKQNRTFFRKVTDYIAIIVMVPVLIICSSGVSIFMTNTIQHFFDIDPMSTGLSWVLDLSPFFLVCLAFTLSFLIIPNTKVKFKYALVSGIVCGVAFQFLQDLFVSGQIYVSKYNAIYGSFAFLPLLLIWLQLSWLIVLFGCVLTYSSQNVFRFNFTDDVDDISIRSRQYMCIIVMSACVQRFLAGQPPLSVEAISREYDLPIRLVSNTADRLRKAGLLLDAVLNKDEIALTPAADCSALTLGSLLDKMSVVGDNAHMGGFNIRYAMLIDKVAPLLKYTDNPHDLLLKDLPLSQP